MKVVDFGIAKQVSLSQAAALPDARAIHREEAALTQDGALVGRAIDGSYYLASAPMSPHRERRCFTPAGMA